MKKQCKSKFQLHAEYKPTGHWLPPDYMNLRYSCNYYPLKSDTETKLFFEEWDSDGGSVPAYFPKGT
jgi:hypothetical protein